MMNPPLEQQLLAGIEERNCVIERQYARIEALEEALGNIKALAVEGNEIEAIAKQALTEQL